MSSHLSPYRLQKAREIYNAFNVFNAISWNLLVGIIISLFALRLGASSTYIGFMSSSLYLALFLLPVGKILAKRFSIIGIFSITWILRSLSMIFAVAAPFFEYAGYRNLALLFILLGVFSFHMFRGIGMIGNNPVLSMMATGPDRGSYMTQIQIIGSSIGMFGSFFIAMILGMEPPIFIFSILLSLGIISGVISGYIIRKAPEPPVENDGQKMKLIEVFKEAFSQDYLKHFIFILFLVVLVSGVTRTFVVVYAREVFGHSDGLVSLYSVFGGLGYLIAGLSVKFLVDRLGAKPLFLVCVILGLICIIPVIFLPVTAVENMTGAILFMVFLFFMLNFGFLGGEGIAQTYFLALIPPEKTLDLGILYFFIFGAAGASGNFFAGLLLDFLQLLGISPFASFKILFVILFALAITALAMHNKMKPLGSLPLKDALEVIFSVRDLRAINLLDRLNKAQDSHEEEMLLGALYDTPSHLSISGLLDRAHSPRLATRLESIRALEKLNRLNEKAEKVLIKDITHNQYTTAYISARILGKHGCKNAIPILRELISSTDFMLAGEAMIALAKMKDEEFRPEIEKTILETNNPRVKIMGAEALGIYRHVDSIKVLFDILRNAEPHLFLRDEAVLAVAAILGNYKKFYPVLVRYVANNSLVNALGMDEVESAIEYCKSLIAGRKRNAKKTDVDFIRWLDVFQTAARAFMELKKGDKLSVWISEIPIDYLKEKNEIKKILAEAVLDEQLCSYNCIRLLITHWTAYETRILAVKAK
ncbi:MAG: MFS transporter [Treponema sp.]|jgi:MFS family permease|nr:MFS transporter [Treponema sp.]